MAIVKLGALTQDVRGSLNGMVFSRNRAGAYVRTKVSPVQPVSEWATRAREFFKTVSQRWASSLSDTQRVAWEAFAAIHPFINVFGDAIILSGVAFFEAVNARLLQLDLDPLDDPPTTWFVEDLGTVAVLAHADPPSFSITITVGRTLTADETLWVFGTSPLPGGRRLQKNNLRLVNSPTNPLIASGVDAQQPYKARWPLVVWQVGEKIGIRVAAINKTTGALSAPVVVFPVIITATP